MKRHLKFLITMVAAMLSVISCNKDEMKAKNEHSNVSISISAKLANIVSSTDTKAVIESIFRLSWDNNDKVFVYDGSECLGELKVSLKDSDKRYAYLEGSIGEPESGTTLLTCVYAKGFGESPEVEGGKVKFSMANQSGSNNAVPFVVTGTIPYTEGTTSITNKLVDFSFATAVIRVNCVDLVAGKEISKAELSGFNTSCELMLSSTAGPTIGGTDPGTITTTNLQGGNGKLTYYVGIPVSASASSRRLLVTQVEKVMGTSFTSTKVDKGNLINVIYEMTTYTPYVIINGLKWALQNLAISDSGFKKIIGGDSKPVKVPGSNEDVIIGDYFQWAAHRYYVHAKNNDQGLVIYESFTNKLCGDEEDSFAFKTFQDMSPSYGYYYAFISADEGYEKRGVIPYYMIDYYEFYKYTGNDEDGDGRSILERTPDNDDVANIILGGSWRMPTRQEFMAMREATYWAWDATDKGYYVFKPGQGTSGSAGGRGTIAGTDDKTKALLFFPAAGNGFDTSLSNAGSRGNYWASNLNSGDPRYAYILYFLDREVDPQYTTSLRLGGFNVRPVSD